MSTVEIIFIAKSVFAWKENHGHTFAASQSRWLSDYSGWHVISHITIHYYHKTQSNEERLWTWGAKFKTFRGCASFSLNIQLGDNLKQQKTHPTARNQHKNTKNRRIWNCTSAALEFQEFPYSKENFHHTTQSAPVPMKNAEEETRGKLKHWTKIVLITPMSPELHPGV